MEPIDVTCGQCLGRLRLEAEAETVNCPHCGAKLAVPPDCAADVTLESANSAQDEATSSIHDAGALESAGITVPSSIKEPDFRSWGAAEGGEDGSGPRSSVIDPPVANVAIAEPSKTPSQNEPVEASAARNHQSEPSNVLPDSASKPQTSATAGGSSRKPPPDPEKGASRKAFLLLIVYASAVTAICLGLAYLLATNTTHQLESLPDVVPKQNDAGEIARVIVPVDAQLPTAHRLQLGQSQRFGDLLVTPLRVTREPLAFTHFAGESVRPPAGEVLKLWLRFENVGEGATAFSPLDSALLFYRMPGLAPLRANNFLAPVSDAGGGDEKSLIPIYHHPIESSWNLAGQQLGTVLAPGESWETFAPSEPGAQNLEGTWVWRLQVRKGIAANGWGVTTLIEVVFNDRDILTKAADANPA